MAFDFPSSPINGQTYTPAGGPTYTYDLTGTKWTVSGTGISGMASASTTEVLTGTETSKAVTPDALAAIWERGPDIAAAATLNIGEGNYFIVTGTATITDIDFLPASKDGRMAWLYFFVTGSIITNGANLILPGAANITAQSGDRMLVVQNASDQIVCLAYVPASGKPLIMPTKTDIGLGNVDNTSDASKPVSTAQQTALNLKSDIASPTFTGDPKAPTPLTADNDTSIATTAHVQANMALKANATHAHPQSDVTNLVADLALKAPLASPALTGVPTVPTAAPTTNTTQAASTAFVTSAVTASGFVPATTTETLQGVASTKSVTPDSLAALWEKGTLLAPAATLNFGEGGYFQVSGTPTTVTTITWATPKDGRTAWVYFAAAAAGTVLTHNGTTMFMPGLANITTVSGDRALFVQDTPTVTVCLAYLSAGGEVKRSGDTMTGTLTIANTSPVITLTDTDTGGDCGIHASGTTGSLTLRADYNNEVAASTISFQVDGTVVGTASAGGNWDFVGTAAAPTFSSSGDIYATGSIRINGAAPQLLLTDTTTGSICYFDGNSTSGSITIRADYGNTVAGSAIFFHVDNVGVGTAYAGGAWDFVGQITPASITTGTVTGTNGVFSSNIATSNGYLSGTQATATTSLYLACNDAGATNGPLFYINRDSASPAANDLNGMIIFRSNDSTSVITTFADIYHQTTTPTNTLEDGELIFRNLSISLRSFRLGAGLQVGTPTGGDKGFGTINVQTAYYDAGVLIYGSPLSQEFLATGKLSETEIEDWDATAPPIVQKEERAPEPVTVDVPVTKVVRDRDGTYRRISTTEKRQVISFEPVYDEDGLTGVDMIEEPLMTETVYPEEVIPRPHKTARVFKELVDSGLDPRDPASYFSWIKNNEALPGMPTPLDWRHNEISSGELISRLWMAVEMLASTVSTMYDVSQKEM